MAEVEIFPHPSHQKIISVIVGSNTNSDPEITTEFEYNYSDGNQVYVNEVLGFTDANNSSFSNSIGVIDGTRFNLLDIGSSTQTYIGGGLVRQDTRYFNKNTNNSGVKPIIHSGNIYFPVIELPFDDISSARNLKLMSSTDTGTTWTELDSANHPEPFGNFSVNVLHTDTRLWFVVETSGTSVSGRSFARFRVQAFDLTAGTWSALDTSSSVPFGETPDQQYNEIHPLPNDRLFFYHVYSSLRAGSTTVDFERPGISIYDITNGTWTSVNNVVTRDVADLSGATTNSTPGTFTSLQPHLFENGDLTTVVSITGMVITSATNQPVTVISSNIFSVANSTASGTYTSGGTFSHDYNIFPSWAIPSAVSGGIHLFYGKDDLDSSTADFSRLYHKHVTIATDNSITYGNEQLITGAATIRTLPCGPGVSYQSGTNTIIEFPLAVSTSTSSSGSIDAVDLVLGISGTSQENPTWSTETVLSSTLPTSVLAEGPWGAYGYNPSNNKIYFVWQAATSTVEPDIRTQLFVQSKTVSGAWGTSSRWKTDSEYWYGHPSIYASDTRLHIVYSKVHPEDLSEGQIEFPGNNLHDYPHYDILEVCPPGTSSSSGNYAYLS